MFPGNSEIRELYTTFGTECDGWTWE